MSKHSTIPAPETSSERGCRRTDLFCLLTIVLTGAALYARTLHVPWYVDDYVAIIDNPLIRDLRGAFTGGVSQRGVAYLTFALNYRIGGLEMPGYHLVNIAIHLASSCLVFLLLKRIFRGECAYPLIGALLFVAHPLQTQSVTYVVQRMTSLAGLFLFLSLHLYILARDRLSRRERFGAPGHLTLYMASLLAGAFAVFSKENTATLPLLLLLFDRFFLGPERGWRGRLLYVAPYLLAPALLALTQVALPFATGASLNQVTGTYHRDNPQPLQYLVTELSVVWLYLRLLILPYGQTIEHGFPFAKALLSWKSAAAAGAIALLLRTAWRLRRRAPLIAFGIGWFFIALLVESTLFPLDPAVEHRLYVPMLGFIVALLGGATMLPRRRLGLCILGTAVLGCAVLTWNRNLLWNDRAAFFEDSLRKAPWSDRTRTNLANVYIETGRIAEAERLLKETIRTNPDYVYSYVNLSKIYADRGMLREAEQLLLTARRVNPANINLYDNLTRIYAAQGRFAEAESLLLTRIAEDPRQTAIYSFLARIYAAQGRHDAAAHLMKQATQH